LEINILWKHLKLWRWKITTIYIVDSSYANYCLCCLFIYCFTSCQNISFIWRRHNYWWRAGKFRPMLRAFGQGGIFIVPHLLWHRAWVFLVSSEGPSHSVAFYDTQGDVKDLYILTRVLMQMKWCNTAVLLLRVCLVLKEYFN
jgi:hypothetical protein